MIETSPKFKSLRGQAPTPEQQNAKIKNVGDLYEKHFLREMVKAMRGTVSEGGFVKTSQAERIFREQLDQEYVEKWGAQGGIGLSEMIHEQLLGKYGAQLGIKSADSKPQGPLPINEKSNFTGHRMSATANSSKTTFEFVKNLDEPSLGISPVKMPWEGKLMASTKLGADEYLLDLVHDNGLKSQIIFKGQPQPGLKGEQIEAGEKIGLLSPEARAFYWNVEPVSNNVPK